MAKDKPSRKKNKKKSNKRKEAKAGEPQDVKRQKERAKDLGRKIPETPKKESRGKESNKRKEVKAGEPQGVKCQKERETPKKESRGKESNKRKEMKAGEPQGVRRQQQPLPPRVFPEKTKNRSPLIQLSLNEVLRIGCVLERRGVEIQRRKAFEWLALNRAELHQYRYETAHKLHTAVGDLQISKELALEIVHILVKKNAITEKEYLETFAVIEQPSFDQPITIAQLSLFVMKGAKYYTQNVK